MTPLQLHLEAKLREHGAESKTDGELAVAIAPWFLVALAEAMGGEELLRLVERDRPALEKIARPPPTATTARWCKKVSRCGQLARWEVWDSLLGMAIPFCDACAKASGFGPLEMRRLGE